MREDLLETIQQKLYDFSGIKIAESQKNNLWKAIEEFAKNANQTYKDVEALFGEF